MHESEKCVQIGLELAKYANSITANDDFLGARSKTENQMCTRLENQAILLKTQFAILRISRAPPIEPELAINKTCSATHKSETNLHISPAPPIGVIYVRKSYDSETKVWDLPGF